ncbi:MAG: hypothetical protein M3Y77_21180 [Actinomycetota bacterium]|nr:hypothetical protein [Actinomycetota bacterium]
MVDVQAPPAGAPEVEDDDAAPAVEAGADAEPLPASVLAEPAEAEPLPASVLAAPAEAEPLAAPPEAEPDTVADPAALPAAELDSTCCCAALDTTCWPALLPPALLLGLVEVVALLVHPVRTTSATPAATRPIEPRVFFKTILVNSSE